MKPLVVTSALTTMNGVFYPTGHVFALFQTEDLLQKAAGVLEDTTHPGSLSHANPDCIRREITHTVSDTGTALPSVGADSDIVRRIDDLAQRGYHGVLIELNDKDDVEKLQLALTQVQATAAFYYRTLIIEELVEQPIELSPEDSSVRVGTQAAGAHPET